MLLQLDLFPDWLEDEQSLAVEVSRLRDQCEKVRKGQYAKIGEMMKMYNELRHEFECLKKAICKEEKNDI